MPAIYIPSGEERWEEVGFPLPVYPQPSLSPLHPPSLPPCISPYPPIPKKRDVYVDLWKIRENYVNDTRERRARRPRGVEAEDGRARRSVIGKGWGGGGGGGGEAG